MKLHLMTSAFCKASLVEKSLERRKTMTLEYENKYLIDSHYPLETRENLKAVADKYGYQYVDVGSDLGSAQSQNWTISNVIKPSKDSYLLNLDPDSACDYEGWDEDMLSIMIPEPELGMLHLNSPTVHEWIKLGQCRVDFKPIKTPNRGSFTLAVPKHLEHFNVTMFKGSALHAIGGGLLQEFKWYGQVEAPTWNAMRGAGFYNAYVWDRMEACDLKVLEDKEFFDWKIAHAHRRTFSGKFNEYIDSLGLQLQTV